MTVPTAASVKLRFPEFADLSDAAVEFAIEEALLSIGNDWIEKYVIIATMYLAAHHLMVTISRSQSGTGQAIKSESMDGMTITYESSAAKPVAGDYTTTSYGSRYLELVELNFPGIAVV